MAGMFLFDAVRLPERYVYLGRGALQFRMALTDVLRNPHGRLLLIVYGIETYGAASLGMLAPDSMEYRVNAPELT